MLACLGCSEKEMNEECAILDGMEILRNVDFINISEHWGLHDKKEIVCRLREILQKYTHNSDITFAQLFERTGKQLVITVTRVNDTKELYYSNETTPTLEVWRAVVASMSIPILFSPNRIGEEVLIDGGMLMNLPFNAFPMEKTVAFLLTRTQPFRITQFRDYLMRIIYIAIDALEREQLGRIPSQYSQRVIRIDTGTMSSFEFSLTSEQRQSIVQYGAISLFRLLHPDVLLVTARNAVLHSILQVFQG
jgi:predicted acylesterase/phospholipase RssA